MGCLRLSASCALSLIVWNLAIAEQARGEAILLDFQTDWCGACRVMEPVVHELAAAGYNVRKINGDQEPDLIRQYRIEVYPTFVALRDGREVGRVSGPVSAAQLRALLEGPSDSTRATAARSSESPPHRVRGQSPDGAAHTSAEGWEGAAVPPAQLTGPKPVGHEQLLAASVRLRIQDTSGQSTGSGTIIDARDGEALILTCGHMFRDFKDGGGILVDLFGPGAPQQIAGALISYDLNSDVALVRVTGGHRFVAAQVAPPGYLCRAGDRVVSLGCDSGADASPRDTQIVSIDRYQHAPNLQVAFEPVQGRSGGGLFNAAGQLIGVCNAADAQDKQGLFAALGAIYAELDRAKLSFVYNPNAPAAGQAFETQLAEVATLPANPTSVAANNLSADERALLDDLRGAPGAEVICLVRAVDDPQAKSHVFQIKRASAAFWRELAGHSGSVPGRTLTSLESRSDAAHAISKKPSTRGLSLAGSGASVLGSDSDRGRSQRIWPIRQPKP